MSNVSNLNLLLLLVMWSLKVLLNSSRLSLLYCLAVWMASTDAALQSPGPGARGETPADQPVRNNEEQRCMAPGPMSPTVPVVLTPHILWGLRHSLGCHGSLASLKMNLHSGLTPWLINTDRERMESDRNG